jgi:hypothetical protein
VTTGLYVVIVAKLQGIRIFDTPMFRDFLVARFRPLFLALNTLCLIFLSVVILLGPLFFLYGAVTVEHYTNSAATFTHTAVPKQDDTPMIPVAISDTCLVLHAMFCVSGM